jgi:hypothetical protein
MVAPTRGLDRISSESSWVKEVRICLKELRDQSLEANKIYVGVRGEELEIDLYVALLNKINAY